MQTPRPPQRGGALPAPGRPREAARSGDVKDAGLLAYHFEGRPYDLFAGNDVGSSNRNDDAMTDGEDLDAGLDAVEGVDRIG